MKKGYVIIVAVLMVLGAAIYLSKPALFGKGVKGVGRTETPPASSDARSGAPEAAADGEEEEVPTVEIPRGKLQMIGAGTAEVRMMPVEQVIRTVGMIDYDERRLFTINAKFEGWIEKLYVDYMGRYVKKGEPLADIYSPELVATQQELLNALNWVKRGNAAHLPDELGQGGAATTVSGMFSQDAGVLLEAARQRLKLWDIGDAQIRKIEESGKPLRALTIYSPASGYVVQKNALQGMKVGPGEKLFDLADLSSLWVIADVYENELSVIKAGEKARISLSAFPGRDFAARIEYIYPYVSGETRTVKVRFQIPNYEGRLKPQMYTNAEVKIDLGRRLAIPDDAVIDTGTRQIVYVDRGEGLFEPREVLLGVRGTGIREVLKGLKAGEKVASSATFLIDSEAQMKNVAPLGSSGKQ